MTDKKFPIAIVGMGMRLPGDLNSEEQLWSALLNGKDLVTSVPDERWDMAKYSNTRKDVKGKSYIFSAGVISKIDEFDNKFFGILPREATDMDPQHRMLLELTWESLENGAQNPDELMGKDCAVYIGISGNEYSYKAVNDMAAMGPYSMTGSTNSIASNRISYAFDFHGPSMSVDTACSSSLVALHQACSSIWQGESSMAIAGGSNMLLHPMPFVGFSKASMLSPDGRCKSFDDDGKGYVRAEGGIILFLKPLSEAEKDGDPIHAIILNSGVNSDGKTSVLPLPNKAAQAILLDRLYSESNIKPNDIAYIEAHGTGTPIGDPIEVLALSQALAKKRKDNPLLIGSIKSNIGHLEPASGLAGVLKATLSLKNNQIPATIHQEKLNSNINFQTENIKVVNHLLDINTDNKPVIIGVNSFGFGGTNAHVILQRYVSKKAESEAEHRQKQILLPPLILSAENKDSLKLMAGNYSQFLKNNLDNYYDIAYTLAFSRKRYKKVSVIQPDSYENAINTLNDLSKDLDAPIGVTNSNYIAPDQPVALVYSGNGSQWAGMGCKLYDSSPVFRESIQKVAKLFYSHADFDLVAELFNIKENKLEYTEIAQPTLFAIQVAITEYLISKGLKYSAVIGHSVGEISAAWSCGALTLSDAVKVIHFRSYAQGKTKGKGRMAAVSLGLPDIKNLLKELHLEGKIEIAGVNGPDDVTVTGKFSALDIIQKYCEDQGVFYKLLDLDYSFHSKKMNEIKTFVLEELSSIKPKQNKIDYISTVTGKILKGEMLNADYWWKNIRKPVQFYNGINYLITQGFKIFLDVGPHPIMQYYVRECLRLAKVNGSVIHTFKKEVSDISELDQTLLKIIGSGGHIDQHDYFPIKGKKLRLPAYPWNKQKFWNERTQEDMACIELRSEHFLLGWRIKKDELSWENHFDINSSGYIADHVVGESVLMPAAGFAEMAFAANSIWTKNDFIEIENIEIKSPLVIEKNSTRSVRFDLSDTDGGFLIRSKPRLSEDDYTVHVTGRIIAEPYIANLATQDLDMCEFKESLHIRTEKIYAMAEHIGLSYGKNFQAIDSIKIKGNKAVVELKFEINVIDTFQEHVLHPVALDMCFQALIPMLHQHNDKSVNARHAFLPVSIGRAKILSGKINDNMPVRIYAEIISKSSRAIQANFILYDKNNSPLAEITQCRFKRAELVPEVSLPETHEFVPYLLSSFQVSSYILNSLKNLKKVYQNKFNTDFEIALLLESLVCQYIYDALKSIYPHKTFQEIDIDIKPELSSFWHWCVSILIQNSFVQQEADEYVWLDVEPQDEETSAEEIWQLIYSEYPKYMPVLVLLGQVGMNLEPLLLGDVDLNKVVSFTGNLYHQYQTSSPEFLFSGDYISQLIDMALVRRPSTQKLKILEIGHGYYADQIIPKLSLSSGIYCQLSNNKSSLLFNEVRHAFFNRWDIDTPITENTLIKEHSLFDIIIVSGLAVNASLYNHLEDLSGCLSENGVLITLNHFSDSVTNMLYGSIQKWWHFAGDNGGTYSSAIDPHQMEDLLQQRGFSVLHTEAELTDVNIGSYLTIATKNKIKNRIFKELANSDSTTIENALIISDSCSHSFLERPCLNGSSINLSRLADGDYKIRSFEIAKQKYKHIIFILNHNKCDIDDASYIENIFILLQQLLSAQDDNTKISLVTQGGALCNSTSDLHLSQNPKHAAIWGLFRVIMNEYSHINIKLIDIQGDINQLSHYIFQEITCDSKNENEIIITSEARYALRLLSTKLESNHKKQIKQTVRLDFHKPGSFKYLDWFHVNEVELSDNEVRIKPQAAGLNFRDVMYSLGYVSDEAVENGFLGATLGMEMSGDIISVGSKVTKFKLGDKVMGFSSGSFSEVVQIKEDAIALLPENWTYADGATIATTFFTVYYSLNYLTTIRKGERILIHGAAGGVGIAAVQLATYLGAEIYATAGNQEKRDYLKLLGVKHIYDSRSYKFVDQILADTNNQGVDVILNSLAGEAINANLRILRPFGRFIELGKRDFYDNTKMGLRPFRNNISYFGVDVDQLMIEYPDVTNKLFNEIVDLFSSGELKPLPYCSFDANSFRSAFRYMQQSKQIGKIILDFSNGIQKNHISHEINGETLKLDSKSLYLVIGGTNGFGFEVTDFLIKKGAKHILLASRSGNVGQEVLNRIKVLQQKIPDLNIELKKVDISDYEQVTMLFSQIKKSNLYLKGVIHAAAVYADNLMSKMSAHDFKRVISPKVNGSINLDLLTKDLELDFFILFSSATTFFGNIGQANYVSANAYMESLIRKRRNQGKPGMYISWGPISDAGYLTRNTNVKDILEHTIGSKAISSATAMKTLEKSMLASLQGVSVMDFNLEALSQVMPIFQGEKYSFLHHGVIKKGSDSQELVTHLLSIQPKEAIDLIIEKVQEIVSEILAVDIDEVDVNASLPEIGVDSLMGAEFVVKLEKIFGVKIPAMSLLQSSSVNGLSSMVLEKLRGNDITSSEKNILSKHGEISEKVR